ncbi:MAG: glucodextranase DOMON-like domain-containing protein, partial [Calditrichia bacterium]
LPRDLQHPIGFVEEKMIRFAVPLQYFPDGPLQKVTALVGGQDDHGAGGVGEFRNVGRTAAEWQGGGGQAESDNPNVYDIMQGEIKE